MLPLDPALRPARNQALFCFLNAVVWVATIGAVSLWARTPFLFPSLGATTFLLLSRPTCPGSSPRNALLGHVIGAAAGWSSFHLFALERTTATLVDGGGIAHIAAAALALGLTSATMIAWRVEHPPAGATTLLFALGFMSQVWHVPMVAASVLLLTFEARLIHRLAGVTYPWWSPRAEVGDADPVGARDAA